MGRSALIVLIFNSGQKEQPLALPKLNDEVLFVGGKFQTISKMKYFQVNIFIFLIPISTAHHILNIGFDIKIQTIY